MWYSFDIPDTGYEGCVFLRIYSYRMRSLTTRWECPYWDLFSSFSFFSSSASLFVINLPPAMLVPSTCWGKTLPLAASPSLANWTPSLRTETGMGKKQREAQVRRGGTWMRGRKVMRTLKWKTKEIKRTTVKFKPRLTRKKRMMRKWDSEQQEEEEKCYYISLSAWFACWFIFWKTKNPKSLNLKKKRKAVKDDNEAIGGIVIEMN